MANENQVKLVDTAAIQQFQMEYDDQYFEINHDFEKLRHILLHLMKSIGKTADYCEAKEHGRAVDPSTLIDEVIPDLFIHSLQLANLFDLDLGKKYDERIESVIKRIKARQLQEKR